VNSAFLNTSSSFLPVSVYSAFTDLELQFRKFSLFNLRANNSDDQLILFQVYCPNFFGFLLLIGSLKDDFAILIVKL
jgi:hypothetical protein